MITLEEGEDFRAIVTPDLRLVFRWSGDRWSHAIELRDGPDWQAFAGSVEADADRDDPARIISPTYQEIQWQREELSTFALLLGSFGPHHFSGVFRVFEPRGKGGRSVIHIDVADRCRAPVDALASTYRVLTPPSTLTDSAPEGAVWSLPNGAGSVVLGCPGPEEHPTRIRLAEAGRAGTLAQIEAILHPAETTRRFSYWWSYAGTSAPLDSLEGGSSPPFG